MKPTKQQAPHSALTACRRGFTLIELLVVVAIIALLAAILFPIFSRVRENARRASCQSNLKQIGMGMMQYVDDSDGIFPCTGGVSVFGYYEPSWREKILPYVKDTNVFRCPSNPNNTKVDDPPNNAGVNGNGMVGIRAGVSSNFTQPTIYRSYEMNRHYGGILSSADDSQSTLATSPGTLLAQIDKPAEKILICESMDRIYLGEYFDGFGNDSFSATSPSSQGASVHHLSTFNVLFGDGHVKAYRPTQTMYPDNMWGIFWDSTCSAPGSVHYSPNCDKPSVGALSCLQKLEQQNP